MYLLWYKVFMHFTFWLYWFNNLVRHLKFKNMRFMNFMIISLFVHVHNTSRSCHTKIWDFSMEGYFIMN
jgi:hypothetical protein